MANPADENRTPEPEPEHRSSLGEHVAFFDRNKDGIVYPHETYIGFRALGFSRVISVFAAVFIHLGLSYRTLDSRLPSLLFPIHIKNIHQCRHKNDSGIYNHHHEFTPQKFDELWNEHAKTMPDRLSLDEFNKMRNSFYTDETISGRLASMVEWKFAHRLLKDQDGYVNKEHIKGIFDGSIFHHIEEMNKKNNP